VSTLRFLALGIVLFAAWSGAAQALSIEPTSLPFSFHGAQGTFEFVGSGEGDTRLDFRVHVTWGLLDQVRLIIGTDPFYLPSTTPGPDVDVSVTAGNVVQFFEMVGGVGPGQSSDVFSTTFPNGLEIDTLGQATVDGLGSTSDTIHFTVVPEPSALLLCGLGMMALSVARSRDSLRVIRVSRLTH
jgi:hypothetical protein